MGKVDSNLDGGIENSSMWAEKVRKKKSIKIVGEKARERTRDIMYANKIQIEENDRAEKELLHRVNTSVGPVPQTIQKSVSKVEALEGENILNMDSYVLIPKHRLSDINNILRKTNNQTTTYFGNDCISLSLLISIIKEISTSISGWENYGVFLGKGETPTKISCYGKEFKTVHGDVFSFDDVLSKRISFQGTATYIGQ